MSWTQVSPNRYERPFDSIESFYRVIAAAGAPLNKEHYLITCTLQLSPLPPSSAVEQAWKALRHVYPQLAAEPEVNGNGSERFVYETITSTTQLDTWAQETFHIDPDRSANDLYEQLTPSPRVHLYYLPSTSEIVFRTPHWRIDGIGLHHMQSAFLQLLADGNVHPIDGTEPSRLCPSVDQAIADSDLSHASSLNEAAATAASNQELQPCLIQTENGNLMLPTLPNILPTTPKRILHHLDRTTTTRLLDACSAHNITITAATHAALALTGLQFAPHPEEKKPDYVGFNPLDLRRYLPEPWNGPAAAVSLYHTGLPFRIPLYPAPVEKRDEFLRLAREFTSLYRRNLAKETPQNVFDFLPTYVGRVMQVLGAAPPDPLLAPAHPELSSMGRVDKLLKTEVEGKERTVRVEEWWVAIEVINRLLLTQVWTFDGELVLSVHWNEAFYERSLVEGVFRRWREVLVQGLLG
ncbi:hypothetical protein ASPBRDRAFT_36995 [Aspergillus brasiliensis CBS 101740]|uniref:Condensation domain-containing protein n=1 Tax=Aspergillus brasiliensis (strain CBS 101740 / IMI 381727 / IBT 21946) TaxID=767769 RepID=A0A1L9V197_ASPBC|nr:hypothetical protein ASPBRDRAFT_36995 [Aspergillus brasiliensis CBS 101740]